MRRTRQLVLVANRLPARRVAQGKSYAWTTSPGGLVSAMRPVLRRRTGLWIGWDGSTGKVHRPGEVDGLSIVPVPLSRAAVSEHYEGFCNSTLWPLYHDAIGAPSFERRWWARYREVNRRFARVAAARAAPGAMVWVHDYHLQLVPAMLRELRPDVRIGLYIHVPFPPDELFSWLPWRTQILEGMLGADLVAFQTPEGAHNFARAARRYAGASGLDERLKHGGRRIKVRAMPISVDAAHLEALARSPAVEAHAAQVRERLAGRTIMLAVDRQDYTKGIPQRLLAFEELLRAGAAKVEEVVMVQVAVPSRDSSPGYREVQRETEQIVGRINGQHSEPGRVAVHYFRRSLSTEQLAAYYRAADIMLVTPLRDGMNLVAKEYVCCRPDTDGVLVLSEFAGAARELRQAILVNPRDLDGMRGAMSRALRMGAAERRRRMSSLRRHMLRHDVFRWASEFLKELR